jgi:mycothiol synthase
MREQGVQLLAVAQDSDPDKYRKLYAMTNEADEDVPTTVPIVPLPFDRFMKWFAAPSIHEDRFWIARLDHDVVGLSVLEYPPERGNVWTDFTATARRVRGRGIARALKLETVVQAIELGVERVRTSNDGENAPILHLNEDLGYRRIPGFIQFLKQAEKP